MLGKNKVPTINLALLGIDNAGHYRVIKFHEETANEMLYLHLLDKDNIMEPIPTPPTENMTKCRGCRFWYHPKCVIEDEEYRKEVEVL